MSRQRTYEENNAKTYATSITRPCAPFAKTAKIGEMSGISQESFVSVFDLIQHNFLQQRFLSIKFLGAARTGAADFGRFGLVVALLESCVKRHANRSHCVARQNTSFTNINLWTKSGCTKTGVGANCRQTNRCFCGELTKIMPDKSEVGSSGPWSFQGRKVNPDVQLLMMQILMREIGIVAHNVPNKSIGALHWTLSSCRVIASGPESEVRWMDSIRGGHAKPQRRGATQG